MSAAPLPASLAEVLARGDIWRGDTLARLSESAVPSGYSELDAELPGGGWPRGSLTEILVDRSGLGELSLLLPCLARLSEQGGWLALVAPPWLLHAPAWLRGGVALERLVVIHAGKSALWCGEQLLVSGGFSGVLVWSGAGMDAKSVRRLQVAGEGRSCLTWLLRPVSQASQPSAAALRLILAPDESGVSVDILKRRGQPANHLISVPVIRPRRLSDALVDPSLSLVGARSAAVTAVT